MPQPSNYYYCYNRFTALWTLSKTTRVSRYKKSKTNLDFTEARDSEWACPCGRVVKPLAEVHTGQLKAADPGSTPGCGGLPSVCML